LFRRHKRTPTHDAGAGEQDAEEVVKEFAEHALRERIIVSIVIIVTIVFIVSIRGMGIINIGLYQEEIKIQPDVGLF
jgi:t-SNARE complex subunit (syntaxin)